jgi:hypothetical protein
MDILMNEVHDTCIEAEKCRTNFGSGLFHLRIGAIDQAIYWQAQYMKIRMGEVPTDPTSEARNIADEAGKAEDAELNEISALFGSRSDADARRKKDQADLKALYERFQNEIAMGIDLTVAKFDEAHEDHDDVAFADWPLTFGKIVKRAYEMQLRKVRDRLEDNRLIDKNGESLGVRDVRDYVCNLQGMLLTIGKS